MKEHYMEKERFDELKLQGREIKCPACEEIFHLSHTLTTGGGWGVVGARCPRCAVTFAIEAGGDE